MGYVNVIWQRDANSACLRSLAHCQSPPLILNITGPELLAVRHIAEEFGERFGVKPMFNGRESDVAILSNAVEARALFGPPSISADQLIEWTAHWITKGGALLNKPTHFEVQDGKF
jgi:nucleoside-diphosphate-sugar epimerase